jgi:hypothetical protein
MLESKDIEISLISTELESCNSVISNIKKDRIRDQKIINDLEIEIDFLKSQVKDTNNLLNKSNTINHIQQEAIISEKIEVI